MSIKLQVRTLDLFTKIVNGNINKIDFIPYKVQKAEYIRKKNTKPLIRTTPEKQGVSSEYLLRFLKDIEKEDSIHTQGIMITRNDSVILEGAYAPFDLETWRITHSLCKSLTGIAVGIAIEEGYFGLNDTISSIFEKEARFPKVLRQKEITIQNLLTMSSGVNYNEVGSVIDVSWTDNFLEGQATFEPGSHFAYNSMNTYMLSAVIQKKTGQNLIEFLEERLFNPLGIEQVHWESSPEHVTKGGWGLYITLEDRTKIAQLFLKKGKWGDRQIVSADWLEQMSQKWMDTPEEMNQYGYGYQVWMGKREGSFMFNGILGQFTIIYPDLNMVISIISSNTDMFVNSSLMDIVNQYFAVPEFCPGQALPSNGKQYSDLKNYIARLTFQKEFSYVQQPSYKKWGWPKKVFSKKSRFARVFADVPEGIEELPLCQYDAEETNASIIPLFIQTMQNNFSQGITSFRFALEEGALILNIEEHDLKWRIPIGFQRPAYSVLDVHREKYQISAWGRLKKTEDDVPVLKLQLGFLETTNCRTLRFYFHEDSVHVQVKEIPVLDKLLDKVIPFLRFALPAGGINTIKNSELVQSRIISLTEPKFIAKPHHDDKKVIALK